MYFEIFLGLFVVLLFLDYFNKRRRQRIYEENNIKGPQTLPLLGNAHLFANQTPSSVFAWLTGYCQKYGLTFRLWVLHEAALFTADAHLMEAILTSQQAITKNSLYNLIENWLGQGLLLSNGKKWFARRKIITPTFHFKILEQFVEIFDQQSAIMVKHLKDKADGKSVVNIFPIVCLEALDVIAETAMGVKINAQEDPKFPYVQAVQTASEISSQRFISPFTQRFDATMRFAAPSQFKKLNESIDLMHDFADKVIRERRAALEKSIAEGTFNNQNDDGSKQRMALLDVLLQSTISGNALSNKDIREEVDTFMFEGHDTTTSGTSYALYLISRHPEVQSKLFEEIRAVLGDNKDRSITMRELQDLKYLECVIKESLRLYPPVPMIGRYLSEDIVFNGQLFPAKTNITVLIFHALRNPKYFKDPDDFKPERFDPSNDTKIDPFAYVPFSAGPRNCIGQKFAVLEMKSTISKILRHFELLPLGESVRPINSIVLRSSNGMQLGLKPRGY